MHALTCFESTPDDDDDDDDDDSCDCDQDGPKTSGCRSLTRSGSFSPFSSVSPSFVVREWMIALATAVVVDDASDPVLYRMYLSV